MKDILLPVIVVMIFPLLAINWDATLDNHDNKALLIGYIFLVVSLVLIFLVIKYHDKDNEDSSD